MNCKFIIFVLLAVTSTASAASDNPREGGFFGGLSGINSGAYDARVQQRKDELSRQETINQDLKEKQNVLDKEAKAAEIELAEEQQRVNDLDEDLASLESDVNELSAKSAKQKTELTDLKRKIKDKRRRMKSLQSELKALERAGGNIVNSDRYRVLQQERNRLADEYKKLLEYSQTLFNVAK